MSEQILIFFQIVFIDLVLAGDNAIIIGMVASQFPTEQRKKIIFWGIGLQFVLALIILRQDYWSFIGMAILAGLITVYQLKDKNYLKPTLLITPAILIFCFYNNYKSHMWLED